MPNSIFNEDRHSELFQILTRSDFGTVREATNLPRLAGIYAFFDGKTAIYVGRTNKRGLGPRMSNHLSNAHNQAVLAYKLAKKQLGFETAYSGEGTRAARMKQPDFQSVFQEKLQYVASLRVKFVEIPDPDEQYLFEFYASKRLNSPNNEFNTH